jgi:hypothetical protein
VVFSIRSALALAHLRQGSGRYRCDLPGNDHGGRGFAGGPVRGTGSQLDRHQYCDDSQHRGDRPACHQEPLTRFGTLLRRPLGGDPLAGALLGRGSFRGHGRFPRRAPNPVI